MKALFKALLLLVGVLLLCSIVLVFVLPNHENIASAKERLESISVILMLIRLNVIALAWWFWNLIVDWYYGGGSPIAAEHLKSRRTTFILLFVVIELLLVQNVLGELWQLVTEQ